MASAAVEADAWRGVARAAYPLACEELRDSWETDWANSSELACRTWISSEWGGHQPQPSSLCPGARPTACKMHRACATDFAQAYCSRTCCEVISAPARGPVPALVLTHDARHELAALMITKYMQLWAGAPLIFYVPYQTDSRAHAMEQRFGDEVRMVRSPRRVNETVEALLTACNCSDQIIFWCLDVWYPDHPQPEWVGPRLSTALRWVRVMSSSPDFIGLSLCRRDGAPTRDHRTYPLARVRQIHSPRHNASLRVGVFRTRSGGSSALVWIHGFWRGWVIRTLLYDDPSLYKINPTGIGQNEGVMQASQDAKAMRFLEQHFVSPARWQLFRPAEPFLTFYESASGAKLQRRAAKELREASLPLPKGFEDTDWTAPEYS